MKNNSFLQSVKCAVKGVASGFRAERNFKIYTIIALVFLALNIITSSSLYDYIILLALTCVAFSAEYIDTAIERLCDSFCLKVDKNVRSIKDVESAAGNGLCVCPFRAPKQLCTAPSRYSERENGTRFSLSSIR